MAVHFLLQDSVDSPQHSSQAGNNIPHHKRNLKGTDPQMMLFYLQHVKWFNQLKRKHVLREQGNRGRSLLSSGDGGSRVKLGYIVLGSSVGSDRPYRTLQIEMK